MSIATSKSNRDAKPTKKRNGPTAPIGFQLHTERLAQERDELKRQKEKHESRQFMKSQQKLLGRKKTEEFARIRLIRPQDRATRQRNNLHHNGKPVSPKAHRIEENEDIKQQELRQTWTSTRPLLSARERVAEDMPSTIPRRPRPQSAKPVLQQASARGNTSRNNKIVSGTKISVRRLENCGYNPMPLATSSSLLAPSQSAAQLRMARHHDLHSANSHRASVTDRMSSSPSSAPATGAVTITASADAPNSTSTSNGSNKQRIVVYMRRLELGDSDDDDEDDAEMAKQQHFSEPIRSAWVHAP